jgi:hypothetical protein
MVHHSVILIGPNQPDALFDRHRQAFPPPERGLESSYDRISPFVGRAVMLGTV